jgi:hypothetical protein
VHFDNPMKRERRRTGAYFTPMSLVNRIVARTLEPHLLWMSEDPEGWGRAHARPSIPKAVGPHQFAHQYPLPCGCYPHLLKRECAEHGEQARVRGDEAAKRREAANRSAVMDEGGWAAGLLLAALEERVPVEIEAMRPWDRDRRIALAHSLVDTIACGGDVLSYGSMKKGAKGDAEVAEVFSALARGIAAGAFQPGGVTFIGMHWDASEPSTLGQGGVEAR